MTFLDSSVIIDMLEGVSDVVECVEDRGQPYLTSSLCVFEVIDGEVGSGSTDIVAVRQALAVYKLSTSTNRSPWRRGGCRTS